MKFHIEDTAKMFGYGVLFGTAGIKILRSRDAKTLVHPRHRRRSSRKGLRNADRRRYPLRLRGYLRRSKEHQRLAAPRKRQRPSSKTTEAE